MKVIIILSPFLLLTGLSSAQTTLEDLQKDFIEALRSGEPTAGFYWPDRSIVYSKSTINDTENLIHLIKSDSISGLQSYNHQQTFKHDDNRYLTAGTFETKSESFLLLTGWRKVEGSWKKEIDVILTLEDNTTDVNPALERILNEERQSWVKLANENNPKAHIESSYTEEATYFGNGQKSEGREEIADRYFYMENPNYQVDLEMEQLWMISDQNVLEVGRYFTGPEKVGTGGIYLILWELQEDNSWLIELDFNF